MRRRRFLRSLAGRPRAAAIALLALTFGMTLLVPPWSDESVGDLGTRMSYAALVLDGGIPYRDFSFEYPPLAAPAIALPGVLGTDEETYRLGIAAVTFLATAVVLVLAGSLARRTGGSATAAMGAVALSPLLIGAVVRLHFDPLAVALTVAALAALLSRRPALGLSLVALGAMTKGFPIVVAPVALAWLWLGGDRRGAVRGAVGLVGALTALAVLWLASSPDGAVDSVVYQLERPFQLESSPASALFAVGALGFEDPSHVEGHGSAGLVHPIDGPLALALAAALIGTVLALALLAGRVAGRSWQGGDREQQRDQAAGRALVLAALAAVTAFAALGKVLSPQYLIWVVPLLALAVAWGMRTLAGLCALGCLLTLVEFPPLYHELVRGEELAIVVTGARNAALVGAVAVAVAALCRPAPGLATRPVTGVAAAPARSIERARLAQPR